MQEGLGRRIQRWYTLFSNQWDCIVTELITLVRSPFYFSRISLIFNIIIVPILGDIKISCELK